jgi:hypothetical protein
VHVCTTTHSALRPAWDPADTPDRRALEGLTLRDLRFAALVTSLPTTPDGPSAEIGPSPTRPTWDDLSASLRLWSNPTSAASKEVVGSKTRTSACAACGGPHILSGCPTRHSIPSPPCSYCHGLHWRVDCPTRQRAQRTGSTVSQTKAKMMRRVVGEPLLEPPPKPCPNCGGAHWKSDCRVPQAPPQLLQGLELPVTKPKI